MAYRAPEIAEKTGFTTRTLNNWIRRGCLPKVTFRGANTMYGEEHVIGLRAIRALRKRNYGISGIRSFFKKATPADIRKVAGVGAPATPSAPAAASGGTNVARWTHVTLAPGVVLLVRDDASDAATKIAAVFKAAFGGAK
jgi:DNA-binding transcriptional MerR regulator